MSRSGQSAAGRTSKSIGRISAIWFAAMSMVIFTACSPNIESHGNVADPEAVQDIRTGTTTRRQVLDLLGTPSTTSVFGSENWYYVGQRLGWVAFNRPEVLERKVLIIRFDKNGVVSAVETRDEKDARQVDIVDRKTPAGGNEFTILEQLLGNIGRVDSTSTGP